MFKTQNKEIILKNLKKYDCTPKKYNSLQILFLMSNASIHLVSKFKDYLIYDEVHEFISNYYNIKTSLTNLKILLEYFSSSSYIFPNYTVLKEGKYIYKNIIKKQNLIDYLEEMEDKKINNHNNISKSNEYFDKIFDSTVYNNIILCTANNNSKLNSLLCLNNKNNGEQKSTESLSSIISLTTKIKNTCDEYKNKKNIKEEAKIDSNTFRKKNISIHICSNILYNRKLTNINKLKRNDYDKLKNINKIIKTCNGSLNPKKFHNSNKKQKNKDINNLFTKRIRFNTKNRKYYIKKYINMSINVNNKIFVAMNKNLKQKKFSKGSGLLTNSKSLNKYNNNINVTDLDFLSHLENKNGNKKNKINLKNYFICNSERSTIRHCAEKNKNNISIRNTNNSLNDKEKQKNMILKKIQKHKRGISANLLNNNTSITKRKIKHKPIISFDNIFLESVLKNKNVEFYIKK